MEGRFLISVNPRLELKAYPTPKRSQNRYQRNPRILAIYRHVPLRQEVAEISQDFPPARRPEPGERLTDREMQIRINLVGSLAKGIQSGKRRTGYPHIARGKLGAATRKFPCNACANAVVVARYEAIAKVGRRRIQLSIRGESAGPGIDRSKFQVG